MQLFILNLKTSLFISKLNDKECSQPYRNLRWVSELQVQGESGNRVRELFCSFFCFSIFPPHLVSLEIGDVHGVCVCTHRVYVVYTNTCLGIYWASLVAQMEFAYNTRGLGSIPGSGRSPGEGDGNPLQCSCLENPMDRGAWRATVHAVVQSQTRLKQCNMALHMCSAQRNQTVIFVFHDDIKNIYIVVQLTYNIVFISDVQKSESVIHIHIYTLLKRDYFSIQTITEYL